ncbi:hypothetical protein QLX67_09490 [Balneolaceae bacterium ANBcel3]|nr:hypothetical protein [Balneolaceae bacterium ANBcel3]
MKPDIESNLPTESLSFPEGRQLARIFLPAGMIALILTLSGIFFNAERFFYSWLTGFTFIASILLGALFFVMVQHVTRSSWSVVLRRIPETISYQLILLPVFFIPILFGMEYLYEWIRPERIATDELTQHKLPYLNFPFFILRNILYFIVWGFLGYKLYKNSIALDHSGDLSLDKKQRVLSAPGILLFALTVAFASFDWMMSMDSHWFSTMFGVYYFSMSFQAALALIVIITLFLIKKTAFSKIINQAHIHDLGALLFGFTVFYAYIAFSQFLLIYYANIPEETLWYYYRFEGSWIYLAYLFLIGRFVLPFILLLNKRAKSNHALLTGVSIWILFLNFLEMFWIIIPILHKGAISVHWLDVASFVGFLCLSIGFFFYLLAQNSLIPKKDPLLAESLKKH